MSSVYMPLTDLLGFFDSDKRELSLQQGAHFNTMQTRIGASVKPGLMEQSSIVENFSGNSPEKPLTDVNTVEYKQLTKLEDDFNKSLAQYTQKQNALLGPSMNAVDKDALGPMFATLRDKAIGLKTMTMDFHQKHQKLNKNITHQKVSNLTQLQNLQHQRKQLDKLKSAGTTLNANVNDNTLQMNSAHMRYLAWFISAVTLGLVAMHKSTN